MRSESGVGDIIATGAFKAGILYNEPPYSELSLQGDLRGFDVDLLRLIANAWGTDIEFVQVTRLNALERLNRGDVHLVAAALLRYRDLDEEVEFSQTYLRANQSLMVRADSDFAALSDLAGRQVGAVIGTRAEKALSLFNAGLAEGLQPRLYLTLDRALSSLTRGDNDGIIAEQQTLRRLLSDHEGAVRILEEPIIGEARAFALRRQDAPLRNLLNRTIQLLTQNRELEVLFREYFPDDEFAAEDIPLWDAIGETVSPAQFATAIRYPTQYTLPRILGSGVLRVGGIAAAGENLPAGQRRLSELNRALAGELAERWSLRVEFVASESAEALALLAEGEVDLVAGVNPDWSRAQSLDFSAPYLLHGDRLMVRANSGIQGFNNLRGRILGIVIGDEGAQERAQAWADSINASLRFFRTTEAGAAQTLLEFNNAHAIFADSLTLTAHLEAHPNALQLTERWYSRSYYVFATPYNDPDFSNLVDYTLQEMIEDGRLFQLSAPLILSDDPPQFEIIPGFRTVSGINPKRS